MVLTHPEVPWFQSIFMKRSRTLKGRRVRHFRRRKFHAAGVNDIWVQDQHDKWGPRFGLWHHSNIDPFMGYNNWLKI